MEWGNPALKEGGGRRFCLVIPGGAVVTSTVLPAVLYHPSRRLSTVIPAQAGIQNGVEKPIPLLSRRRIPAYAGMTVGTTVLPPSML